jgi:peptidyl-prolyl cis-trans isomerase B (cyclophilin B)
MKCPLPLTQYVIIAALAAALSQGAGAQQAGIVGPPEPAEAKPTASSVEQAHPIVVLETARGVIKIELYPEEAPQTVANFLRLVEKGFYNGLAFHRVVPNFVIQGGDPKGDGTGGPGYTIPDEKNKTLTHTVGAVAMAKTSAPHSAGSQFYIVIGKPAPHLDRLGFTIFGRVIAGQEIAEGVTVGDKMTRVALEKREETQSAGPQRNRPGFRLD